MGKLPGYYVHPEIPDGKVFWDGQRWQMGRYLPSPKPLLARLNRRDALWISAGAAVAVFAAGPLSEWLWGDDNGSAGAVIQLPTRAHAAADDVDFLVPNFIGASLDQVKLWKQRNSRFAAVTIAAADDCHYTAVSTDAGGTVLSQNPLPGSTHKLRPGGRIAIRVAIDC